MFQNSRFLSHFSSENDQKQLVLPSRHGAQQIVKRPNVDQNQWTGIWPAGESGHAGHFVGQPLFVSVIFIISESTCLTRPLHLTLNTQEGPTG